MRKRDVALSGNADMLLLEDQEREPNKDLESQFVRHHLDPEEKKVIGSAIESINLRREARWWSASGKEK